MKISKKLFLVTLAMFLAVTFTKALTPQPNTMVYVTVNTHGLVDASDIELVKLTFYASNGTWVSTKDYVGNGEYRFMAIGYGPGVIRPSIQLEDPVPGVTFQATYYQGNWQPYGGDYIYLTIDAVSNSIIIDDPISL